MLEKIYKNLFLNIQEFFYFYSIYYYISCYKSFSLKIDASSDTLVLENDKDLAYHQLLSKRYKTPDFLVIAFSPNDELLSNVSRKTIKTLLMI